MCGIPENGFTRRALLRTTGASAVAVGAAAAVTAGATPARAAQANAAAQRYRTRLVLLGAPEAWRPAGLLGPAQARWRRAGKNFGGRLVLGQDLMQLGVGKARA